jgi:hypothetical protein
LSKKVDEASKRACGLEESYSGDASDHHRAMHEVVKASRGLALAIMRSSL